MMESNPGYLLRSFLLYHNELLFKQLSKFSNFDENGLNERSLGKMSDEKLEIITNP